MYSSIEEHELYLSDERRLEAYESALRSVVFPGCSVLDLGSGTGVFGMLACRAGAALVYSVDCSGMVEVARQTAVRNGYADRIRFIKGFSTRIDLPDRVDILVADQIGNFGVSAGMVALFADARMRLLRPQGVTIPRRLGLWLCAVETAELFRHVDFWATRPAGLDFGHLRELSANIGYQVDIPGSAFLGQPDLLLSVDLNRTSGSTLEGEVSLTVQRDGAMHGLGGWFDAELAEGVGLTNSPMSPNRINRRQIFLPVDPPILVTSGDLIRVRVSIRSRDLLMNWMVAVYDGYGHTKKGVARHSTWKGLLLSSEDLRRSRPEYIPRLSSAGIARRTLLDLCNGSRSLAEIEEIAWFRYGELYRSREHLSEVLAEVLGVETESWWVLT